MLGNYKYILCFLALFMLQAISNAQLNEVLMYNSVDKTLLQNGVQKINNSSQQAAHTQIQMQVAQWQKKGFITCTIDSVIEKHNTLHAYIFLGKQYSNNFILIHYSEPLLTAVTTTVNSITQLNNLPQQIVQQYAQIGYPFCSVRVDSIYEVNNSLHAAVGISKGLLYKADSVVMHGKINISNRFIGNTIQLKKGDAYNEKILLQIDGKLNALPFLQTTAPSNITMLASSYRTNLFVAPKKSNQINILIGMMPANNQNNGKTLLTGEATVQLHNAFAKGEMLYLHWQQLQPQTPLLDIQWRQPYIFNSLWSSHVKFNLFKRDSSFLNIDAFVGAQLANKKNSQIQVGVQFFSTNIITVDTALVKQTKQLPAIADIRSSVLNLSYFYNTLNANFNASKGLLIEANTFFGNKNILRNNAISQLSNSNFNFNSLYDSIQLNTYQLKIQTKLQYILSLKKQQLLVLQQHNGWLQSGNYFTNELYRIGGFKLLRGFDEESILANRYAIFSVAYRLQLGNSGYFETFVDGGFTGNAVTGNQHNFISGGFGLALQSKQGILNIGIANGKQNNLPFNFNQTKLHIGFVSLF
jgi:hypothetical protein